MKHLLAFLLSFVFSVSALAQGDAREGMVSAAAASIRSAAGAPSGSCSPASTGAVGVRIYGGAFYYCNSGTWAAMSGGGGTTINSTNGQLPYRVNGTTFGDSAIASNALNSTYLSVTSGASGAGVTVALGGGGTNENLSINAKGTGTITINPTGNGVVINQGALAQNSAFSTVSWNNGLIGWSSAGSVTAASTLDTGFGRTSAGVIRINNGSTGAGQLLIGTSTDTVSAQLDVRSQNTTRPAARFQAASTTSGTQEMLGVYDGAGTLKSYFRADGGLALGGNQTFSTDNTYDIGASGASRPANVNVGTSISIGTVDFTNAPLNIRANGAGLGFIISRSATEYTEFISGGIEKGLRGVGTVPFKIKNDGDIFFVVGGTELLRINATTGLIQFSGTSASFPALKRSSTGLQVRLADDTDFAPFYAATVLHKAYTVATLPSAATFEGAIAYVTDANATTRLATVAGGGSNKVIVYSDGTNWVIL